MDDDNYNNSGAEDIEDEEINDEVSGYSSEES